MQLADPKTAVSTSVPGRRRPLRERLAPIALLGAGLVLAACDAPALPRIVAPVAPVASAIRASALSPSPALRDLRSFALNALLVPLLDDDLPSRFADPSLAVDCDAADVTIDGRHPDIGSPVPREPFVVRWNLRRCAPLDDYIELSGEVELRVEPTADGYTAHIVPNGLVVVSMYGSETLEQPFDARMAVGR